MARMESQSRSDLPTLYGEIKAAAVRLAGGPGDMPQRVALLHAIFADSCGNHASHVAGCIRYQGVLPERFFANPVAYGDELRAAV